MPISIDSDNKGAILVAGNNDGISNSLFKSLTNAGYQVLTTKTQEMTTDKSVSPDLILLDIPETPTKDFDICRYLKEETITPTAIPKILMIPQLETRDQIAQCQLNSVDYIFKPINQQRLISRIETHLKLKNIQESLVRKEAESQILFQLTENISQAVSLEVILQTITVGIQNLLKCDRVLISSNINNYDPLITQALGEEISPIITNSYNNFLAEIQQNNPSQYQQYQQGQIQVIEDINNHNLENSEKEYLQSIGIKSQLMIPICLQNINLEQDIISNSNISPLEDDAVSKKSSSLWGWLIIHQCQTPKTWQQPEITFLQHLVKQIVIAIRQNLLEKQLLQQNQKLQQLTLYDPLTQVYNRRYLEQQLSLEWRRLQRLSSPLSIIICDIDYFDAYKNIYGQQAGDKCLQQVAQILLRLIKRPADFVSLYSEEKFAIILPHTPLQGAQKIAKAIKQTINQLQLSHVKSAISPFITLSLGITSTIPSNLESPNLTLQAAEQALYFAKSRGRNCYAIYNQEISRLKVQQQQDLTWSKRLHNALEKNLFCLYAQAIEPLDTQDQRKHYEILIRLQDQDNAVIAPNDFLPIANRFSMMPQIDSWVIDNLFTQLTEAHTTNYQKYVFTINISGASLNDDIFLDFLQSKIIEYHLDPQLFCFEITESVAINNIPKISNFIKALKNLGCSFALDDFGTGVSSLTYLKELPVDYVKIDGSFIRDINNDSVAKSMVTAINNIAQIIGLKTIAEFVEDRAILKTIQELNIDYAQGFYFAKPCLLDSVIS
ncbi:MAG: EAL domain-containing protein [Xenococcus sp. (in: cyanobacteria)]